MHNTSRVPSKIAPAALAARLSATDSGLQGCFFDRMSVQPDNDGGDTKMKDVPTCPLPTQLPRCQASACCSGKDAAAGHAHPDLCSPLTCGVHDDEGL